MQSFRFCKRTCFVGGAHTRLEAALLDLQLARRFVVFRFHFARRLLLRPGEYNFQKWTTGQRFALALPPSQRLTGSIGDRTPDKTFDGVGDKKEPNQLKTAGTPARLQRRERVCMPLAMTKLFEPFTLQGLALPNRIVMAPMTRNFSPGGVPGPDVAAYYRRRAEGGVGLIVTEGTIIDHRAAGHKPDTPRIYGEAAIAGWSRVVEQVRSAGGHIMMQLWHLGANHNPSFFPNPVSPPVSPSGFRKPGEKVGEPMTQTDIDAVIEAFAQGAATAQRVGFDGIELHGAHGYIIDQFFWNGTNYRTDNYGGSLPARIRFAAEIIQECRRRTGPHFPIVLRFSQWKVQDFTAKNVTTPEELAQFLDPLAKAGVDAFHCSQRRFWEPEFPGSDLNLAGWTKKLTGKPTITVGTVSLQVDFLSAVSGMPEKAPGPPGEEYGRAAGMGRLMEMFERGDFDLVAVGRALLADPAWPIKVSGGRFDELIAFTPESRATLF